ncbi:MAG TPA: sensor histidine kinase [Nitrososphaeraceae archaeon]|nr:sensor histidine kinase [Nitrososphaeraceae archaeon]
MSINKRSRRNLGIIAIIITIAISLSLISYQYSQYSAAQIEEISIRDTRSNAEIQAYNLGNALDNKLDDITSLLRIIGASRSIQEADLSAAASVFNEAQLATSDLVDFYMWLDKDGRIVWISNINQTSYEQYRGLDLSYRLYFSEPKATHNVYYSSIVDSNDRINRLYISYPIIGKNVSAQLNPISVAGSSQGGDFRGTVVAGIRTDVLGKYLEDQISPNLEGQVGLIDRTGIILYLENSEYVSKNVFGVKFQSFLQSLGSETIRTISSGLKLGLQGYSGSEEISVNGKSAFVYTPILLQGNQFGVLYIIAPYSQVAEVTALVNTQKNLSILLIIAIGASAVTAAIVILQWNKNLEKTIAQRTALLREANEQLTVHDKLQREFINIAAHELRTPLQPILGLSQILESKFGERSEEMKVIARNARRLERLTEDILDVSKIESGALTLNIQTIDLDEVISSVIMDYRNSLTDAIRTDNNNKKEKVKIKYEPKKLMVKGDRERIQQVISNLINNALRFTKEGAIIVKTQVIDGLAQIAVKDTGSGIDPEIMPRLFEKFATKSEKGTGLGLYISNNIVQAHGGKMWAENNADGKGATFAFTLPLEKKHSEDLQS